MAPPFLWGNRQGEPAIIGKMYPQQSPLTTAHNGTVIVLYAYISLDYLSMMCPCKQIIPSSNYLHKL